METFTDKELMYLAGRALDDWNRGQDTVVNEDLIKTLLSRSTLPTRSPIDTTKIRELSARQSNPLKINLFARAGKLVEETGEFWQELLKYLGIANASASASGKPEALAEEAVDVLINTLDILAYLGLEDWQINEIIQRKCAKWERKLDAATSGTYHLGGKI